MTWREAHEEGMFAAADAHDQLRISTDRRIDVYKAIEDVGLTLLFRPLRGVAGLYAPPTPPSGGGILISALHPPSRQRFTAAHELGHFWLGHQPSIDQDVELLSRGPTNAGYPQEMVADAFAAWFLMPPELVDLHLEFAGLGAPRDMPDVYRLALRLGTSFSATAYHLVNLKLATFPAAAEWCRNDLRSLKVALSKGVPMPSYRNDVWNVSSDSEPEPLHAAPGDRLAISSGREGLWYIAPQDEVTLTVLDQHDQPVHRTDLSGRTPGDTLLVDIPPDFSGIQVMEVDFQAQARSFRQRLALNVAAPPMGLRPTPTPALRTVP